MGVFSYNVFHFEAHLSGFRTASRGFAVVSMESKTLYVGFSHPTPETGINHLVGMNTKVCYALACERGWLG